MNQTKYEKIRNMRNNLEVFLDNSLKEDINVVLPENISKSYLLNNRPTEVNETKWLSGCYYIIHTIVQLNFDKRYLKGKRGDYVPLTSKLLKTVCGRHYKSVFIDTLIKLKIIERNEVYSIKRHASIGYRLTKKYRGQPLKYRTLTDKRISNSIVRHRKKRLQDLKQRVRPIAHVARWAIDKKFGIDTKAAVEYLESYRCRMLREISKRNLKPIFRNEQMVFVNSRYYKAKHQVESWTSSMTLSIDGAGGRLYSRLTSLMSPLRHFLNYDGESLVSFDLKNSQPLHFLLLLQPAFWKKGTSGMSLEKLDSDLFNYIKHESGVTIKKILSAETYSSKGFQNPGFPFLVKNGKLYEFMCKRFFDHFNPSGKGLSFNTRNKSKTEVLKLMYFNPHEIYSSSHIPFQIFEALFPVEGSIISLLKKRNYKDFSVLLQKIEAQLLLHVVCREIYEMSSEIPLFTIHDSILTTRQYASVVQEVLFKKYTSILGFTPKIERQDLNSQQAELERMKYVRNKIDQAEIEVSERNVMTTGIFSFLKCEHWNIDKTIRDMKQPTFMNNVDIPGVPSVKIPLP